jgi:hypothetical protein
MVLFGVSKAAVCAERGGVFRTPLDDADQRDEDGVVVFGEKA